MTDHEMTKRCAQAMGFFTELVNGEIHIQCKCIEGNAILRYKNTLTAYWTKHYDPLHDDAQNEQLEFWLIKHGGALTFSEHSNTKLTMLYMSKGTRLFYSVWPKSWNIVGKQLFCSVWLKSLGIMGKRRAIVECVAKMQKEKTGKE